MRACAVCRAGAGEVGDGGVQGGRGPGVAAGRGYGQGEGDGGGAEPQSGAGTCGQVVAGGAGQPRVYRLGTAEAVLRAQAVEDGDAGGAFGQRLVAPARAGGGEVVLPLVRWGRCECSGEVVGRGGGLLVQVGQVRCGHRCPPLSRRAKATDRASL